MNTVIDNREIEQLFPQRGGTTFPQNVLLRPIEEDDGSPIILSEIPSKELMDKRVQSGLQQAMISDSSLARDLAMFGSTHKQKILQAYGMTEADLDRKLADTAFKTLFIQIRNDIDSDKQGGLRARAGAYLDVLMERVFERSMDRDAPLQQVLKSAQFIAGLADAMPSKNNPDGTVAGGGTTVVFNIGERNPLIKDVSSIDTGKK